MLQDVSYDTKRIVDYMRANHEGFANRAKRDQIARALFLEDRYFRDLYSQVPEIMSSSEHGIWILPQEDPTGGEYHQAMHTIGENRRRAISLFLRSKRQKKAIQAMVDKKVQLALF